jgi:hypothetical protein
MNDSQWDAKLKTFLKKTGDDFKRFGTDVKEEAQKLLTEVQDPKRQQKLRDGLKDVGVWAKKTAEEVATLVETGVKKAEGAIGKASDKANDFLVKPVGEPQAPPPAAKKAAAPAPTPPSPPPEMDEAPAPSKKTVGKGAAKKKSPAKKSTARKTIGKKGPAEES